MARVRTVNITNGVPDSGTGDVPTLDNFISEAPVSAAFTPGTGSHAAGDSIGGAATFTGVGISGKMVMICAARLTVSSNTVPTSAFRLWMFNATPTVYADDAVFGVLVADLTKYVGVIDLGTPVLSGVSGTATISSVFQPGLAFPVKLVDTTIVAYLTNATAYAPVAQAHTVTLFTYPLS